MVRFGLSISVLTVLVLSGAAASAHAQTASQLSTTQQGGAKPKVKFSTESYSTGQAASPDKQIYTGQTTRNVMRWEGAGRWGLKIQLDQPVARGLLPKDMEAGAFYKVTPGLRVGGAVGLSEKPVPPSRPKDEVTPRVKLETTLKF